MKNFPVVTIPALKVETHPYDPIIFSDTLRLIVGTFPGKDFTSDYADNEETFYYGGRGNMLWKILSVMFMDGTPHESRIDKLGLLRENRIGMMDVIYKAIRIRGKNSDDNLYPVECFDLPTILEKYAGIETIYFTSEYCFYFFKEFFSGKFSVLDSASDSYKKNRSRNGIIAKRRIKFITGREISAVSLPSPAGGTGMNLERLVEIYSQNISG